MVQTTIPTFPRKRTTSTGFRTKILETNVLKNSQLFYSIPEFLEVGRMESVKERRGSMLFFFNEDFLLVICQ